MSDNDDISVDDNVPVGDPIEDEGEPVQQAPSASSALMGLLFFTTTTYLVGQFVQYLSPCDINISPSERRLLNTIVTGIDLDKLRTQLRENPTDIPDLESLGYSSSALSRDRKIWDKVRGFVRDVYKVTDELGVKYSTNTALQRDLLKYIRIGLMDPELKRLCDRWGQRMGKTAWNRFRVYWSKKIRTLMYGAGKVWKWVKGKGYYISILLLSFKLKRYLKYEMSLYSTLIDNMKDLYVILQNCTLLTGKENEDECHFARQSYNNLKIRLKKYKVQLNNTETDLWNGYFLVTKNSDTLSSLVIQPLPVYEKVIDNAKTLYKEWEQFVQQNKQLVDRFQEHHDRLVDRVSKNINLWRSNFDRNYNTLNQLIQNSESSMTLLAQTMEKAKVYQIPDNKLKSEYEQVIKQHSKLNEMLRQRRNEIQQVFNQVQGIKDMDALLRTQQQLDLEKKYPGQDHLVSSKILDKYIHIGDIGWLHKEQSKAEHVMTVAQSMASMLRNRLEEYEQYTQQFKSLTQKKSKIIHYLDEADAQLAEFKTWMDQYPIKDVDRDTYEQMDDEYHNLSRFIEVRRSIIRDWGRKIKELDTTCVYTDSQHNVWCLMEPSRYNVDPNAPEFKHLRVLSQLLTQDLDIYEKEIMRDIKAREKALYKMKNDMMAIILEKNRDIRQQYKERVKRIQEAMKKNHAISEKTFKDVSAELQTLSSTCTSEYYEKNAMEISARTKTLTDIEGAIQRHLQRALELLNEPVQKTNYIELEKAGDKLEKEYERWYKIYTESARLVWQRVYKMKAECNANPNAPWYEHVWKTIWRRDAKKAVRNQLIQSGLDEKVVMDAYKKGQIKDVLKAASVVGLAGVVGYMGYRLWQQQRNRTSSANDYKPQSVTYTIRVVDILDIKKPGYLAPEKMKDVMQLINQALYISKSKDAPWYKKLQYRVQRMAQKIHTTTSNVFQRFLSALGISKSEPSASSSAPLSVSSSSKPQRFRTIKPGMKYELTLNISPVLKEGIQQTILQQLVDHGYTTLEIMAKTKRKPELIVLVGQSVPSRSHTTKSRTPRRTAKSRTAKSRTPRRTAKSRTAKSRNPRRTTKSRTAKSRTARRTH